MPDGTGCGPETELLSALSALDLEDHSVPDRLDGRNPDGVPLERRGCNYILFSTIRHLLPSGLGPVFLAVNLPGNGLAFLPLGLFSPLLWEWYRRLPPTLLPGGRMQALIEPIQPAEGRDRDIDDVI